MASDGAILSEDDMEKSLKVIIVGNGQVGKTSLATRYAKGVMTEQYKKTIGTDFMEKDLKLKTGEMVKLMLWDTAGQEMFAQLTKQYYRGAGAVIYVFSTTDRDSFLEIERWKGKVEAECGEGIVSCLVQNKIDLLEKATMQPAEVEDLAKRIAMKLYRVCVKDNVQVDDVFQYITECWIKKGGDDSGALPHISDFAKKDEKQADAGAANKAQEDNSVKPVNGNSPSNGAAGNSPSNGAPASAQSSGANGQESTAQAGTGKAFQLGPSKQRTGGTKRFRCAIL